MKLRFIFISLLLLFNLTIKSQESNSTIGVFANFGVPIITNFDYKPSFGGYGDLGIKLNLTKNFSIIGDINAVFFRKLLDSADFVSNYYTQVLGFNGSLMYEKSLPRDWFIGISAGLGFGYFNGFAFSYKEAEYMNTTGEKFRIDKLVYGYKASLNARKYLNRNFDLIFGVTYFDQQFNFLDMYDDYRFKEKFDLYLTINAGVLFKLYTPEKKFKPKIRSKKIKCPKI